MITTILVGGGAGKRLGAGTPKAFVNLAGRPLLFHSLGRFYCWSDEIFLVLPGSYLDRWRSDILRVFPKTLLVNGGNRRQDSVANAIDMMENRDGVVLVHDVARPFCSEALIDRVIKGAKHSGACIPAIDCEDTLKQVEAGRVFETLERSKIGRVQTPQGFDAKMLAEVYRKSLSEGIYRDDDAALFEYFKIPVHVVDGERKNLKITEPEDIEYAEFISAKEERRCDGQ